jgi:hypothetical protein
MWRPRLRSVIAVLLLWQLMAALLLAGPAMASVHAGMAQSASTTHCHTHGTAGETTLPGSTSHVPAHTQHTDSPDCCQGMHACNCVCAQGTAAIPEVPAKAPLVADHPAQPDLHSPPFVRRIAEVFRPPI